MLEDLSYINVRDLLESTGIYNISESSGEISFSCPSSEHFHGDTSPSARMNSRTTLGICHGCGQRWNAITFLSWHKSLPETVARRLLEERYGGGGISAGVGTLEDEVKRIMNPVAVEEEKRIPPAESWLDKFGNALILNKDARDYLAIREFTNESVVDWELGYDDYSKRITIPIKDESGKLVGFKGRSVKDGPYPKYMILGGEHYGFDPYQKSKYVFGLNKVLQEDGKNEIVLVEGELNVLAMDQYGFISVGIAGSEFSDIQMRLVVESCCSVILFLDNDKAGNKGTKQVVGMLSPYMPIKIVQNAAGDAADLDAEAVRDLINNAQPALILQAQGKL